MGKHAISLYSTRISPWLKIKNVRKLCQDIENDPIIKDQMASLGCLLVCTFGNFLAPVLVAAHTVNNLDLGGGQNHKNRVMKRKGKIHSPLAVDHKNLTLARPKDMSKMTELCKNVFWYVIREMCHKKMLPAWRTFFVLDYLKKQEACDKSVEEVPRMLSWYVPDNLKYQGMCINAVKDPLQLRDVSDYFKTQELCNKAVGNKPCMLGDVPDLFKTQEMCETSFEKAS